MKYTTYDAALKMKICEEYVTGNISYPQLSEKYLSSLLSWIRKYKAMNNIVPLSKSSGFYKAAPRELSQELEVVSESQFTPLRINGIDISTNAKGIRANPEMIGLDRIKNIYIYPGMTDFRNGIYGLRKGV